MIRVLKFLKTIDSVSLAALSAILALTSYSLFLFFASIDKTFDITDESFYLLNIRSPRDNIGAVTVFGYYLGLFGGDVVALRLVGLAGILATSCILSYQAIRLIESSWKTPLEIVEKASVYLGVFLSALGYYRFWLVTPSYNWFAYLGACLVGAGGTLALRKLRSAKHHPSRFECGQVGAFIGAGGVLALIGRPTSALMLGLIAGGWCLLLLRLRQCLLIGSISIGLCCAFILFHVAVFDDGWRNFVEKLTFAVDLAGSLNAGQTLASAIRRLGESISGLLIYFLWLPVLLAWACTLTILLFAVLLRLGTGKLPFSGKLVCSSAIISATIFLYLIFYQQHAGAPAPYWPGPLGLELNLLLSFLLVSFLYFLVRVSPEFKAAYGTLPFDPAPVMILLCLASLGTSFGSTAEAVEGSGWAFGLYAVSAILASSALLPGRARPSRLVMVALISGPTTLILLSASKTPYRQPTSMNEQSVPVAFWGGSPRVRVDEKTATWINGLLGISEKAGWRAGTPLIDLTGATPGAALVLAAHAPTTPWLVGGYPGSTEYTRKALAMAEPAVLRSAWILTAPEGERRIDTAVLGSVGLDFPESYALVGSIRTGYREEMQFLWKPEPKQ